jgi:outer membrane protein insertion porin family
VAAWLGLLFGLLVATPAFAQTITAIYIEGNQRIEDATVISYMRTVVGDRFDAGRVNESLKSLFATGLFADVTMRRDGDALIVTVVENPIINRLAFEGNKRIEDDILKSEVQLRPRTVYTRTRVQTDVARVLELYRRSGRFAASVEPKVIQLDQNRVDLVFEISEGPPTGVQRIVFIGNENFSDGTLREIIQTKQSRWWRFLTTTDSYDPDRLSFDRELLRRYYLKEGFADFRVINALAELTPDRSAFFITFTIDEGQRYHFGKVELTSDLPGLEVDSLDTGVSTEEGDWYNADEIEENIADLSEEVGSLGFAFVDVRPQIVRRREDLAIDVTYNIVEGPRIYVQRVEVTGNERTLDRIIRRNVRLAEGDAFNEARLRRSLTLIQNLGFFSRVDFNDRTGSGPPQVLLEAELAETPSGDVTVRSNFAADEGKTRWRVSGSDVNDLLQGREDNIVLNVDVEEQSTGEVTFGGGFSTTEGPTGAVGIRERNLLGRGQDLALSFVISGVTQDLDLSFTEPYFLNRDVSAGFDVFRREREFQNSGFDRRDLGFSLRSGYPLSEFLTQTWRYTLAQEEIIPDDFASPSVQDEAGESLLSRIDQTLLYDRRNNRIEPSKGYFGAYSFALAGLGGDKNYLSQTVRGGHYFSFWEEWVTSTSGEVGYVFGLRDNEDVLISDRFFLGGNSFRGFETAGVGPRDLSTGGAVGGNFLYKGTLELAFPIGLPTELGVKGRVFGIAGSLTGVDETSPTIADTGSIRAATGVGISWASPFGPVRLDLTKAVVSESFDQGEVFSFGFGSSF